MITLRPATASDQKRIVEIIHTVGINPMDLKWKNFTVAVDEATGAIVGTGQIKTHGDGSRELASIAVLPNYRHQGIAHQVMEHLLAHNTGTLYLTCLSTMGSLYEPFGFRVIGDDEMTPYFRRLKRISKTLMRFVRRGVTLLVMKREEQ
jgi:N-acetylglutamate synthase-like GNAT family acetyltransferase